MSVTDRRGGGFNVRFKDAEAALQVVERNKLKAPVHDEALGYWTYGEDAEDIKALTVLRKELGLLVFPTAGRILTGLQQKYSRVLHVETAKSVLEGLRPYQREGVDFALERKRVLIADSMGLGKTVQALMAVETSQSYPCIIICPASVKASWAKEIHKWIPWRRLHVLSPLDDEVAPRDFIILNPESLNDERLKQLLKIPRKAVVFDESHYFKNPDSRRSRHAAELAKGVPLRLALTGTPIKNTRKDLVMQLRVLDQLDHVLQPFMKDWPRALRTGQGIGWETAAIMLEMVPATTLHDRLKGTCMIRRTKEQVGDMLPPFARTRLEEDIEQLEAYARRERDLVHWVKAYQQTGHTGPLKGQEFTTFRHHVSALRQAAALAKIQVVAEWAEGLQESGERVVIFCYHKEVARQLAAALPGRSAVITGETHIDDRKRIIDHLGSYDFLVATMDSTGQGVDGMQLHASHVAFVELDWTPTKHEQCEGRLHRIGQRSAHVNAWYFIARGTIDVEMMRRLDTKWSDIQGVVDGLATDGEARFLGSIIERVIEQQAWSKEGRIQWTSEATA